MKVLVLKPKMMVDDRTLLEAYNRIIKEIRTNGVTMISDYMFDYETVEIDEVRVEEPKEIDGYNFDNTSITFKIVTDAKAARDYLINMVSLHGFVTIAHFERYVKHPTSCRDNKYGWTDLKQEEIKIVHIYKYDTMSCCYFDQFYLELPEPELIE